MGRYHQLFSIFNAVQDVYYPKHQAIIANRAWGVTTTIGDSLFAGGEKHALIRAVLVPPTTASISPFPIIDVIDGNGDKVFHITESDAVAANLLCGPDGFLIEGGFSVEVSGANGGYLILVYDIV